jgi:hypothetical protein
LEGSAAASMNLIRIHWTKAHSIKVSSNESDLGTVLGLIEPALTEFRFIGRVIAWQTPVVGGLKSGLGGHHA